MTQIQVLHPHAAGRQPASGTAGDWAFVVSGYTSLPAASKVSISPVVTRTLSPDHDMFHVQIETSPVLPRPGSKAREQEQSKPLAYKIGRLLALSLLATIGRRLPILGWFIAPLVRSILIASAAASSPMFTEGQTRLLLHRLASAVALAP